MYCTKGMQEEKGVACFTKSTQDGKGVACFIELVKGGEKGIDVNKDINFQREFLMFKKLNTCDKILLFHHMLYRSKSVKISG